MVRHVVLFDAVGTGGGYDLWITNGTAAGTTEIGGEKNAGVSGAGSNGLNANYFVSFGDGVLFAGDDAASDVGLWETNGTAAGTSEIGGLGNTGISGAYTGAGGLNPNGFTVFNGETLFDGQDAANTSGLWVTNGTAAGAHELTGISGADTMPGDDSTGLTPYDL